MVNFQTFFQERKNGDIMEKSAQTTKKFIGNLLRYLLYFTCIVVTPICTKPIAPYFDWVGYGQMRAVFSRGFACGFWAIQIIIILVIEGKILKKKRDRIGAALDVDGSLSAALQEGKALQPAVDDAFRAYAEAKPEEGKLPPKKKNGKKYVKVKQPPLPLWNVFLLTLISVVCILLIRIQTEFKVKPIYDIGEKVTGHQLYSKIALLALNVVKCIWIMFLLHASYAMAVAFTKEKKEKAWLTWLICGGCLMVFGALDSFLKMQPFAWTYLLFYAVFTLVYCLTKRSKGKAFGLILLIYIF